MLFQNMKTNFLIIVLIITCQLFSSFTRASATNEVGKLFLGAGSSIALDQFNKLTKYLRVYENLVAHPASQDNPPMHQATYQGIMKHHKVCIVGSALAGIGLGLVHQTKYFDASEVILTGPTMALALPMLYWTVRSPYRLTDWESHLINGYRSSIIPLSIAFLGTRNIVNLFYYLNNSKA